MNDLIKLIDPATALVIVTAIIKLVAPSFKALHLSNRQEVLYNQAKAAVTYAAQQTHLDDDQRRKLAEQSLAAFVNQHGIQISQASLTSTIEYAYQMLKNSKAISIAPYAPQAVEDKALIKEDK